MTPPNDPLSTEELFRVVREWLTTQELTSRRRRMSF